MMTGRHSSKDKRVIVAGAGPAGLAAALWAKRLGLDVSVLERAPEAGGQLTSYSLPIVDLPGFGPDSGQVLVRHLLDQLRGMDIPVLFGRTVMAWDGQQAMVSHDGRQDTMDADWFFYAPGLRARALVIPGQQWIGDESVSDLVAAPPQSILVVGAGDRAVEGALRLARAGHAVTVLCRSGRLAARPQLTDQLAASPVDVRCHTRLVQLEQDGATLVATLDGVPEADRVWRGTKVLVRIGMEPDVVNALAWVQDDFAFARPLRMSLIGDAALPAWERSLVTAFGSAMGAVKAVARRLEGNR